MQNKLIRIGRRLLHAVPSVFGIHDLDVVCLLCDRVIVMNRGKIIEQGPANEVLRNPRAEYTKTLIQAIPHFEPTNISGKLGSRSRSESPSEPFFG
uniref:Oligopeptide/dipeptide transporter, C-terminal region n=1 Tax=Candidatus Kentrum sp. LPFa TaxID=2126335 RepID=A0A450WYR6_9GAMM|nr:MAG: Oligopeptide/dipeptide transporter, C-terminal region [Candidatus Kentron sp. LPFa]VFK35140.1 MAG: Oligopeptide/dipeptide transporter, C-terminal region [Candidatus Kentron sp. LPFa]